MGALDGRCFVKSVARQAPLVDPVACSWLIQRFEADAEFLFAPADEVLAVVEREGATPYDLPDATLGHHNDECSLHAIVPYVRPGRDARL